MNDIINKPVLFNNEVIGSIIEAVENDNTITATIAINKTTSSIESNKHELPICTNYNKLRVNLRFDLMCVYTKILFENGEAQNTFYKNSIMNNRLVMMDLTDKFLKLLEQYYDILKQPSIVTPNIVQDMLQLTFKWIVPKNDCDLPTTEIVFMCVVTDCALKYKLSVLSFSTEEIIYDDMVLFMHDSDTLPEQFINCILDFDKLVKNYL